MNSNIKMLDDNKKIGIGLCIVGLVAIALGVLLFFERKLLAVGSLALVCGIVVILGAKRAVMFFSTKGKWKGSVFFFLGFVIIIIGWPMIGFLVEMYGAFVLFANFITSVISYLKMVSAASEVLVLPGISHLVAYFENRAPSGLPA